MPFRSASVFLAVAIFAAPAWAVCEKGKESLTPTTRYVLKGGEAYDKTTHLTWQRCSLGQAWKDGGGCVGAITQVSWDESLKTGEGVWRMPTKDELASLGSPTCKNPAINEEVFPNMEPEMLYYWSSTALRDTTAWYVDFYEGVPRGFHKSHTHAVRLVHDGQ